MANHYGGLMNNIDHYRRLVNDLDQYKGRPIVPNTLLAQEVDSIKRMIVACGTVTDWMLGLKWDHHQTLPTPYIEITRDEYMLLGVLGHESELDSYYDGFNIPDEKEWFGGWPMHTSIYHTYGLAVAHLYQNQGIPNNVNAGKGEVIQRDRYGFYIVRYFRIGCNHNWVGVPEESRMCYHVSRCTLCGTKKAIDSSD